MNINFLIWVIFAHIILQEAATTETFPNSTGLNAKLTSGHHEAVDREQGTITPGEDAYSLDEIISLAKQMTTYKAAIIIQEYVTPFIVILGLVGNTLSGLVVFQKHNRPVTCYFYMGVLAVTDSVFLACSLFHWSLIDIGKVDIPYSTHETFCNVLLTINGISALSGTYIILAMTLDRLIAVKWPLKSLTWSTMKRARVTAICLIILAFLVKLPYGWITKPIPSCVAFQVKITPLVQAYYWINSAVSSYIPFTVLLILNPLIVHTMHKRGKYFKKDNSSETGSGETRQGSSTGRSESMSRSEDGKDVKKAKSETSLTRMLLLVTFSFLFLNTPMYVFYLIYLFVPPFSSPGTFGLYSLAGHIAGKLFTMNFAINF